MTLLTNSSDIEALEVVAWLALCCRTLNRHGLRSVGLSTILQAEVAEPGLEELFFKLKSAQEVANAGAEIKRLGALGIRLIPYGSAGYPAALKNIYDAPVLLFAKGGDLAELLKKPCLAIVGARKADCAGCEIAFNFAEQAARAGACIVSGLAYGIDGQAHLGALEAGQDPATVAILGNGLEFGVYPRAHERLAQRILDKGGCLVSQFPPLTRPYPSNFLDRNRVISGLSRAVLIVQAAQRSGALATARYALEAGRDVLVVPGDIRDERYAGSNRLVKEGAYVVTEFADVMQHFPDLAASPGTTEVVQEGQDSETQVKILSAIKAARQIHYDELLREFHDVPELATILLALESDGLILRLPGNYLETSLTV